MKHNFDFLDIGTKIILSRPKYNATYPSQVLEFINTNEIIISGPIRKGNYILVHKDEIVQILYYVENKGKYSFRAKVISHSLSSVYTLKLRKISDTHIVQLRDFYRLPVSLEVKKSFEKEMKDDIQVLDEICEAKDISGGGIRLLCNYKHNIGDKVVCCFNINSTVIEVKGTVVRVEEVDVFHFNYSIGISFNDISELNRDQIVAYIFQQQRILRGKGLI